MLIMLNHKLFRSSFKARRCSLTPTNISFARLAGFVHRCHPELITTRKRRLHFPPRSCFNRRSVRLFTCLQHQTVTTTTLQTCEAHNSLNIVLGNRGKHIFIPLVLWDLAYCFDAIAL